MTLLRRYKDELGFWPAITRLEDVELHRRLTKALEAAPSPEIVAGKFARLRSAGSQIS